MLRIFSMFCLGVATADIVVPFWTDDAGYCKPLPGVAESVHRLKGLETIYANVGEFVIFKYSTHHDLWQHPTLESYENCEYRNATQLGKTIDGGGCADDADLDCVADSIGYSFVPSEEGHYYFTCSIGDHCPNGQKLEVVVGEDPPTTDLVVPFWTDDAGYCKPVPGVDKSVHRPNGLETMYADVGQSVIFKYSTHHDLWLHPTLESYDDCDYEPAMKLGNVTAGGGCTEDNDLDCIAKGIGYSFVPSELGTYYFTCSLGDHCANGQKLVLVVGDACENSFLGIKEDKSGNTAAYLGIFIFGSLFGSLVTILMSRAGWAKARGICGQSNTGRVTASEDFNDDKELMTTSI